MTECENVIFIIIAYSRVRGNDEEKCYFLKSAKSDDFQKLSLKNTFALTKKLISTKKMAKVQIKTT